MKAFNKLAVGDDPVECCSFCRVPLSSCSSPSCDDEPVYLGVLDGKGDWVDVDKVGDEAELRTSKLE